MAQPVVISNREELKICSGIGVNPIFYNVLFKLDIDFRMELQQELFGLPVFANNRIVNANDKFYHYCWDCGHGLCENCDRPLPEYSATFVSHILSRSSYPELAHDPRNHNILCGLCHSKWESLTNFEMRIFLTNQIIIKEMKIDYNIIN